MTSILRLLVRLCAARYWHCRNAHQPYFGHAAKLLTEANGRSLHGGQHLPVLRRRLGQRHHCAVILQHMRRVLINCYTAVAFSSRHSPARTAPSALVLSTLDDRQPLKTGYPVYFSYRRSLSTRSRSGNIPSQRAFSTGMEDGPWATMMLTSSLTIIN